MDRASISGFIWSLGGGGGLISWSAKKENCITLSSTKAEYVTLTHTIQEGIWLHQSLGELHLLCPSPLVVFTDNQGMLSLSTNNSDHGKAKHIDIQYHFIRSHIENNAFQVRHIAGTDNTADIFTKSLARVTFSMHTNGIRLVSC